MIRRRITLFVVAAMIAVPQLAGALPRPDGVSQTLPETQLGSSITLNANDSVGTSTPQLISGRSYRIEVTGQWKPSSDPNNSADAAFETTNGSTWTKTGKGFVIAATNLGGSSSPVTSYRSDHKYSIQYAGRGIAETIRINDNGLYNDNTGSLTVKIFQQSKVKWSFVLNQPVTLGVPKTDPINADTRPYAQSVTVTGEAVAEGQTMTVNEVPTVRMAVVQAPDSTGCPTGFRTTSLKVYLNGVEQGSVPFNCQPPFSYDQSYGGPANIVIPPLGTKAICNPTCSFPLIPEMYFPVWYGSPAVPVLPEGSSVEVTFSWEADVTRLWRTFVSDDPSSPNNASNQYVAPFNPLAEPEREWFRSETSSGRLALSTSVTLYGPNRQPVATTIGWIPPIPGMGQIIESMFQTRLDGK